MKSLMKVAVLALLVGVPMALTGCSGGSNNSNNTPTAAPAQKTPVKRIVYRVDGPLPDQISLKVGEELMLVRGTQVTGSDVSVTVNKNGGTALDELVGNTAPTKQGFRGIGYLRAARVGKAEVVVTHTIPGPNGKTNTHTIHVEVTN